MKDSNAMLTFLIDVAKNMLNKTPIFEEIITRNSEREKHFRFLYISAYEYTEVQTH